MIWIMIPEGDGEGRGMTTNVWLMPAGKGLLHRLNMLEGGVHDGFDSASFFCGIFGVEHPRDTPVILYGGREDIHTHRYQIMAETLNWSETSAADVFATVRLKRRQRCVDIPYLYLYFREHCSPSSIWSQC